MQLLIDFLYFFFPLPSHFPIFRVKVLECSAKDDINVTDLFKTMLSLSRILPPGTNDQQPTTGLKRRSSAYVSATSKGKYFLSHYYYYYYYICASYAKYYMKTIKY